jgi:hypothetical protein
MCPLIVFKGTAKSPHIKAHLIFRLAQKSHLTAVGREQQAEHSTDRPAERLQLAARGMVTPPTHQHAIGHVTIVQMSQDQKNCDDEQF